MTEKEFLDRYDHDKEFTSSDGALYDTECAKLAWGDYGFKIVEEIEGDSHRWTQDVTTIFKVGDRHFAIDWDRGLTELQDNYYYNQPYEVVKQEKQIVVTEWVAKEKDGAK